MLTTGSACWDSDEGFCCDVVDGTGAGDSTLSGVVAAALERFLLVLLPCAVGVAVVLVPAPLT